MAEPIKNHGTRSLRHTKAFEFWRINNQNIQATADEYKHSRQTIYNWIQNEDWETHAAKYNILEAEKAVDNAAKQSREHLVDGTKAIEVSRTNHKNFQTCIQLVAALAQELLNNAQGTIKTAADMAALIKTANLDMLGDMTMKDANIASKLYPSLIPQRLEIGEIKSPADLMILDRASDAEFKQLTDGEAEA